MNKKKKHETSHHRHISYFWVFLLHRTNLFSERPVSKWRSYLTVAYFFPTFTIPFVYFSGLLCMETFINPLYKWYDVCQASFRNKCQSFLVPQVLIDLIATRICCPTIIIMKHSCLFISPLHILIRLPLSKPVNCFPSEAKHCFFVRKRFLGPRRIGWNY